MRNEGSSPWKRRLSERHMFCRDLDILNLYTFLSFFAPALIFQHVSSSDLAADAVASQEEM